jgi:hypothetical protein
MYNETEESGSRAPEQSRSTGEIFGITSEMPLEPAGSRTLRKMFRCTISSIGFLPEGFYPLYRFLSLSNRQDRQFRFHPIIGSYPEQQEWAMMARCRFSWFTGKPSICARISGTFLQDHRNFAWLGENSRPILANFTPRKLRRPLLAQKPLVGHRHSVRQVRYRVLCARGWMMRSRRSTSRQSLIAGRPVDPTQSCSMPAPLRGKPMPRCPPNLDRFPAILVEFR